MQVVQCKSFQKDETCMSVVGGTDLFLQKYKNFFIALTHIQALPLLIFHVFVFRNIQV